MVRVVLVWSVVWVSVLVAVGTAAPVHAGLWDSVQTSLQEDLTWSAAFKNETAYRFHEPRSFTKIRNILSASANYRISDNMELTASGWGYYDLAYDLFDYRTISARARRDAIQPLAFLENLDNKADDKDLDLREFYLDIFFDSMDIRIGRQFVVWGVMTGVRIVDEVNPMDFREMILLDLMDYRIPLWKVRVDYYGNRNTYQLLWIPDIRPHKPAPNGSEWEMLQEVPGTIYPSSTLETSEFGFRVGRNMFGTEFTLNYLYTWDDFPVVFRRVPVEGAISSPEPEFFPTYTRIHLLGGTFQRPFFGQILKGEAAYVADKYFGIGGLDLDGDGFLDNDGVTQRDHVRWGVGLDFNIFRTDVSVGLTQWIILDYTEELIQDEIDNSLNVFIRREIPDRRAEFSMLGILLLTLDEGYIKPKVTFNMTNRFQIGVGLDIFWGKPSRTGVGTVDGRPTEIFELVERFQFFGNFSDNDRLFVEFRYAF